MTLKDARTQRWFSQRWIFDAAIQVIGVEPFTGGSLTRGYEAIGNDISEVSHELKARIKKFSDITRECKRIATLRFNRAAEEEFNGHLVTARENYFVSSVLFGCARWPIWDDEDQNLLELTQKISKSYEKYSSISDHPVEKVEIQFEGKRIYSYLHLPKESKRNDETIPCVVVVPGMDTFKEELVRLYGDKFLQRGFAVLAIDGPGQGESLARGLKLSADNFDRAGKAVMDKVVSFSGKYGINKKRIGLYAASFGSFWGPRIMAYDDRYTTGAFTNICHEPGMNTIFNGTLPSFKARHMWMTGIYDEDEFDEYRSKLTLDGVGEKIVNQSILIAAGSEDPLSPIEHTYSFFNSVRSKKKKLLVYEGEEHRISDPLLPARIGDFIADAFSNKKIEKSGAWFLERSPGWTNMKPL